MNPNNMVYVVLIGDDDGEQIHAVFMSMDDATTEAESLNTRFSANSDMTAHVEEYELL